jgi:CBS domain-containing protein/mannitol/fructose-specific phosphotransferase system IIA component (Ntr-type)
MKLASIIPPTQILLPLPDGTLHDAILHMVHMLARTGVIGDTGEIERAIAGSRARDVVSISSRVALPHDRTDAASSLTVALGIASKPLTVPDATLDKGPRIIALILAPPREATLYLQTISALARLFRQESAVEGLLAAKTAEDVLALPELTALTIQPRLAVRDVMITAPGTVAPDTAVRDAVALMIGSRSRALPVVGDKNEVLGIISEWDVMRGFVSQGPRTGAIGAAAQEAPLRVRDIMTRSVLCISEDLGLEEAANMMINKDVEQFPVVAAGKLTGFLTRSDIIRKLFGR